MSNTLLQNRQIFILIFGESVVLVMLFIAFFLALLLLVKWDFTTHSKAQYKREREAWLLTTIITFATFMKFILLPYFIFTIDYLSAVVPGAMCSAGVISFNSFGMPLLYIKLFILFTLSFWLTLNHDDLQEGNYPWFRMKIVVFIVIFALVCSELWLEYQFFAAIDIHKIINCCSTLYGLLEGMNPLPYGLDIQNIVLLFFLLFALIVSAYKSNNNLIMFIALLGFGQIAYYGVIYFFAPYIYEQPNHNCPFCMLQQEYYYVGYLLWGLLGGGLFTGLSAVIAEYFLKKKKDKLKKLMLLLLSLFVLLSLSYVVFYYIQNGVFLQEKVSDGMSGMIM